MDMAILCAAAIYVARLQIIANPPYQLSDGGYRVSASPIYQLFVEQAKKLNPRYLTMIIPARWYAGGKGLDSFREAMLHDESLRVIHDYPEAADCFSGVQIKGGICYFLWDRDNKGQCAITTHRGNDVGATVVRPLLEKTDGKQFLPPTPSFPSYDLRLL